MKNLRISLHVVPLILAATFYLSLSGFQCASSMMNTADLAVNSGDWAKAKQATEEELALRPTNGKAWFLLGQSEYNLGNLAGMSKAFDKAEEHKASEAGPVSNREMGMMSRMTADAWNQIVIRSRDASRKKQYAVALAGLDTADMVQAGNPIAIRDRGLLLAASGKADEAAATDIEYIAATKGVIEAGVKEGLELAAPFSWPRT